MAWLAQGGCAAIQVRSDFDPAVDFSRLHRFAWQSPPRREEPGDDPLADSTLIEKHVYRAVVAVLIEKEFVEVPAKDADFLVRYGVDNQQKRVDVGAPIALYHHPFYGVGHGYWLSDGYYDPFLLDPIGPFPGGAYRGMSYIESHLIIDILALDGVEILWRGWAEQFGHSSTWSAPEIDQSVRKLLECFPPQPLAG